MRLLALLLFFLAVGSAQANDQVPESVKAAFEQMHPDVHELDVHWEVRKEAIVATFNEGGGLKKAFFAQDGEWLETRVRLYTSQLPRAVFKYLESIQSDADVTFMAKVLHPGGFLYRIESETFEEVVIELLDRQGTLLEKKHIPFTEGLELY
ncbi:MAG: PepSY-like domain-containing protein [Phaeodactylibacter sp.]|nr:PepSY-like domain-containing protein [Phaeodactylibacter sp.]